MQNITKKYKLTDEVKIITKAELLEIGLNTQKMEITLHRIEALIGFGNVEAGDKGGWIESEDNLSHEGDCWVSDESCVFDKALVSGGALVSDEAWVYGDAQVSGSVRVSEAWVCGNTQVSGDAIVLGGIFK